MKSYTVTFRTQSNTTFDEKMEATDKHDIRQLAVAKALLYHLTIVEIKETSIQKPFNSICI
jgi:hypothetical protein